MTHEQAIAETAIFDKIFWKREKELISYEVALREMQNRAAAIRSGEAEERLWFLEHPRLYTAGTSAKPADLINRMICHFRGGARGAMDLSRTRSENRLCNA